ncbi:acyl carrier protein [Sphingobacterium detergens]|uniref:Phosphopantetheine binding protein n=1 Tax=Sphingobacterium detergens TaxID=1145106 RepID=A0A420ALR4_SPHD1|nr:acyl carrier protein [Sphingobacterium detergens]RKE45383.1 phosphopantetheine binding protein [Sphingobacterium detergens]
MNTEKFLELLKEELELESDLQTSTNLKELDEWDSMVAMLLIGLVSNEFDVNLTGDDINSITTVQSLMEKIGAERFE